MRILIFGDSITWGADDQETGGWIVKLKVDFKREGKFYEVFNLADPGKATDKLLLHFESDCKFRIKSAHKARDMIILQAGLNDSQTDDKGVHRIEIEQFRKNIKNLIEKARQLVDNVVVIGPTPVDDAKSQPLQWNDKKNYSNDDIKRYNEAMSEVCEVPFIDVFGIGQEYIDCLDDGVHPNAKGHVILYDFIKQKIWPLILPER